MSNGFKDGKNVKHANDLVKLFEGCRWLNVSEVNNSVKLDNHNKDYDKRYHKHLYHSGKNAPSEKVVKALATFVEEYKGIKRFNWSNKENIWEYEMNNGVILAFEWGF